MVAAILLTIIGSAALGFTIWVKPYMAPHTESTLIFIGLIVLVVICYAVAIYKFEDATYFFHRLFGSKDPFGKPYKTKNRKQDEYETARFCFACGQNELGRNVIDAVKDTNISVKALLGYALVRGLYGYKENSKLGYKYLEEASNQNDGYAKVYYYYLYTDGKDNEQDEQEGLNWLEEGVQLDNPLALVEKGIYTYKHAGGNKEEYKKAESYFRKAHSINNNYGYEELADIYLFDDKAGGLSAKFIYDSYLCLTPKTSQALYLRAECLDKMNKHKKALKLFTIAANAGNEDAALTLAQKYMHGENVDKDSNKAISYLNFCINKGNPKGYVQAGYGYLYGLIGEENVDEAKKWFKKAADKKDEEGMWFLGFIAERNQDYKEALKWYEKAAELGSTESVYSIGEVRLITDSNPDKALKYLKDAASQGHVRAMAKLGMHYENEKDYDNAFKYLKLAAENDHAEAQAMLGSLYADGRGCTVDMNKSFYWIKKSAENGSVKGACYLSYSYEVGAGCEKNQALAEYWDKVSRERIESMISEL